MPPSLRRPLHSQALRIFSRILGSHWRGTGRIIQHRDGAMFPSLSDNAKSFLAACAVLAVAVCNVVFGLDWVGERPPVRPVAAVTGVTETPVAVNPPVQAVSPAPPAASNGPPLISNPAPPPQAAPRPCAGRAGGRSGAAEMRHCRLHRRLSHVHGVGLHICTERWRAQAVHQGHATAVGATTELVSSGTRPCGGTECAAGRCHPRTLSPVEGRAMSFRIGCGSSGRAVRP